MIHASLWLYIRSALGFLESVPQCPQAAETAQEQRVQPRFPLTVAHLQLNEAEQQPRNRHPLRSHTEQPKTQMKVTEPD